MVHHTYSLHSSPVSMFHSPPKLLVPVVPVPEVTGTMYGALFHNLCDLVQISLGKLDV